MLKPGCLLPNLTKDCLRKPTIENFIPSQKAKEFCWKVSRKNMVCWPSLVSTHNALVDDIPIPKTTDNCLSTAGIHARQVYSYSMRQPLPTIFYYWNDFDDVF